MAILMIFCNIASLYLPDIHKIHKHAKYAAKLQCVDTALSVSIYSLLHVRTQNMNVLS